VVVLNGLDDSVGVGDVVVTTSGGYITLASGAFATIPITGAFVADFDSGADGKWISTGDLDWVYATTSGSNDGPASGLGGIGKFAQMDTSIVTDGTGNLTAYFNQNTTECVDVLNYFSVYYHMWGTYDSLCVGALDVYYQKISNTTWIPMITATTIQTDRSDSWLKLEYNFTAIDASNPNSDPISSTIAAIKIVAKPYHGQDACIWWSSVNIDNITINSDSTCPVSGCNVDLGVPTGAPVPSPTISPTIQNCSTSILSETAQLVVIQSVAEAMQISHSYVAYISASLLDTYSVNLNMRRRLTATTSYNLDVVVELNVPCL